MVCGTYRRDWSLRDRRMSTDDRLIRLDPDLPIADIIRDSHQPLTHDGTRAGASASMGVTNLALGARRAAELASITL